MGKEKRAVLSVLKPTAHADNSRLPEPESVKELIEAQIDEPVRVVKSLGDGKPFDNADQLSSAPLAHVVTQSAPVGTVLSARIESAVRKSSGPAQSYIYDSLVNLQMARYKAQIAIASGIFTGDELALLREIAEL